MLAWRTGSAARARVGDLRPRISGRAQAQASFHPVGRSAHETLDEEAEAVRRGGLRMLRAANRYMYGVVRAQFAALPAATAGADLIVGAGIQMAASSVAERNGAAYRYVAYVPTLLPSRHHAPCVLPLPRLPQWGNRLAWWPLESIYNLLFAVRSTRAARRLGPPREYSHCAVPVRGGRGADPMAPCRICAVTPQIGF